MRRADIEVRSEEFHERIGSGVASSSIEPTGANPDDQSECAATSHPQRGSTTEVGRRFGGLGHGGNLAGCHIPSVRCVSCHNIPISGWSPTMSVQNSSASSIPSPFTMLRSRSTVSCASATPPKRVMTAW